MYVIIYFGLHCRGLVTTGIPEYLNILCVYMVFFLLPPPPVQYAFLCSQVGLTQCCNIFLCYKAVPIGLTVVQYDFGVTV